MERKFVYSVEGFMPPGDARQMGGYGFSAYLDREFARRAREYKADQHTQDRFQEIGKDEVIKKLFSNQYVKPPYNFVEDSLLVQFLEVPGNACDLGASWDQIDSLKDKKSSRNFIEYHPHNVDNVRQAYALFSLFSKWVEYVEALTSNPA